MISWKARETVMIARQTAYTGSGEILRAAPSPIGMEMRQPTTVEVYPNLVDLKRYEGQRHRQTFLHALPDVAGARREVGGEEAF